jgi:hypothetical protein
VNICLFAPSNEVDWFGNIMRVLKSSIKDIGFSFAPHYDADIIIAIQHFPSGMIKKKGVKYILYQIEQYSAKTAAIDSYYAFEPDEIWGFDIENKKEKYVPLGYHSCLEFPEQKQDIDISFMGCITERRKRWFSAVRNNPKQIRGFNHDSRGKAISRTKINLNLHAFGETKFTEWDRISHFLANGCFFISEDFYCPGDIVVPQFCSESDYDMMADFYLRRPDLREELGKGAQEIYKSHFDMRNILSRLLKE